MKKIIMAVGILAIGAIAIASQLKSWTATADLTSAKLQSGTAIGSTWLLHNITVHASEAITETVTIYRDSNAGANYDTVLKTQALTAATDFMWLPEEPVLFSYGDELDIEVSNANTTGSVYVEIAYEVK